MADGRISIRNQLTWISLSQAARGALQIVGTIALARILAPNDYGVMAIVGSFAALATLFAEFGTGAALIQKKTLTDELTDAVFSLNIFFGLALSAAFFISAAPISKFFNESRLNGAMIALSPVFLISSSGMVYRALLERSSSYRLLARIEILSSTLALCSAIGVALAGGGVYALVTQSLAGAITASTLLFLCASATWRPRIAFRAKELRKILGFSTNNFTFGFVNYLHRNSDSLLIGRLLGPVELGFYSTAYKILLLPLSNITAVVNRASFSVYSRHQEKTADIGRHYTQSLERIAFLTGPIMALIWSFREPLVYYVLGEKWLRAAEILAWLAPVGFIQSLVSTSGTVFNSIGRSDLLRNLGIVGTVFFVGSFAVGIQWGIMGVAVCYFFANALWICPVLALVLKQLGTPSATLISRLIKPLALSLVIAAAGRWTCLSTDWPSLSHLI